ncbi:DBR1-domain-containing protein [Pseudovirgaria hyperparasitica]|uniref:DBR1-domain-containing protein n=1 Tax=Pseudovirgaria hyperparasitica TaxID=470096 RepID=A0A6A6WFI1_9PEZI|nr:DBR1-domain-containing protein [Pseudovirgaria hyperparasitica]KAF2761578.1 DBR1-domain-containing protein [Pseudovirgaria hyperparasitica]
MSGGPVRIAVEGCGHGTLHSIYASVARSAKLRGWEGVDLVIICGDFQAVRNSFDLNCMSVPPKYREIGDFHEYYSGRRLAPYPTIFIGGNHEACNHNWELYYGGWAAPNIYYMGAANVVRFGPLRIAGLSGIWKGYNYRKPHHERIPYSPDDVKSAYHIREWDVRKLLQLRTQVDIGLSHDWPRKIEWLGDWKTLFAKKVHFEKDARDGSLGSPAARYVLDRLRPPFWFSAHLHVKFAATVTHKAQSASDEIKANSAAQSATPIIPKNDDEIDLDMDDGDEQPASVAIEGLSKPTEDLRAQLPTSFLKRKVPERNITLPTEIYNQTTQFLALDKCLAHREFLQLLEVVPTEATPVERPFSLQYDKEWLAITRVFAKELIDGSPNESLSEDKGERYYRPLIEQEETWVESNLIKSGRMGIPEDFAITAPAYDAAEGLMPRGQPVIYKNPHTQSFCDLIQIPNAFQPSADELAVWEGRTSVTTQFDDHVYVSGRGASHRGRGRGSSRGGRGSGRGQRR